MRTAIYLPNFLWRTLKVVIIDLAHARCLRPLSYYVRLLERMGVVGVIWISDVDHELTLGPSDNLDLNALVKVAQGLEDICAGQEIGTKAVTGN